MSLEPDRITSGAASTEDGEVDRGTSHRGTLVTIPPDAMPVH